MSAVPLMNCVLSTKRVPSVNTEGPIQGEILMANRKMQTPWTPRGYACWFFFGFVPGIDPFMEIHGLKFSVRGPRDGRAGPVEEATNNRVS